MEDWGLPLIAPGWRFATAGLAAQTLFNDTAHLLLDFLSSWILAHGFDGIYLDGRVDSFVYSEIIKSLNGHSVDSDGDGVANSFADIVAQYQVRQDA